MFFIPESYTRTPILCSSSQTRVYHISYTRMLIPLVPTDFPPNMRYLPRISPDFLKILSKYPYSMTGGCSFGKMWKNMKKRPFFRAATAALGSIRLYYI